MTKKNIPLFAAFAIPILLIIFVAASIYLPGLFAPKPKYDFLYLNGGAYANPYFSVVNGYLTETTTTAPYSAPAYPEAQPQLYVYNVAQNQSRPITLADAEKLTLDPNIQSPDGFEVVTGNSGGSPLFFDGSNDYGTEYIEGHTTSWKLNIVATASDYNNFTFLGWIND